MKKNNKRKSDARVVVSIRLHKETIKDIDLLAFKRLDGTRTSAIRYLLRLGFSSLGNWRKN